MNSQEFIWITIVMYRIIFRIILRIIDKLLSWIEVVLCLQNVNHKNLQFC